MTAELKAFLDEKVSQFNTTNFIKEDPVSIPHSFSKKQDIEIAGFFAAVFSWGNRKMIINKSRELIALMDNAPYDFITGHTDKDLKRLMHFKHRTFNTTDLLYFIHFLSHHYSNNASLESAFIKGRESHNAFEYLSRFHDRFFSLPDSPSRTRKHIPTPVRGSACKRINMFLRWMVRQDNNGVDFGIWHKFRPAELICPLDLHVSRVARKLKLLTRKQDDWKAAMELTENLRKLDKDDPVKYDYALFGLGIIDKF
jgi:uncharacterized protein (TIGR02757 family)